MAACEKCWADAGGDPDAYTKLVLERTGTTRQCTPEESAGPSATECPYCKRMTVHQFAKVCLLCNWRAA